MHYIIWFFCGTSEVMGYIGVTLSSPVCHAGATRIPRNSVFTKWSFRSWWIVDTKHVCKLCDLILRMHHKIPFHVSKCHIRMALFITAIKWQMRSAWCTSLHAWIFDRGCTCFKYEKRLLLRCKDSFIFIVSLAWWVSIFQGCICFSLQVIDVIPVSTPAWFYIWMRHKNHTKAEPLR